MAKLPTCPACTSFVPLDAAKCPHCLDAIARRPSGRWYGGLPKPVRGALLVGGGGLLSMTLSACYGGAYPGDYDAASRVCDDPALDLDRDGHCGEFDCDETDPARYQFAYDPAGDGIDQNCDGLGGPDSGVGAGGDAGDDAAVGDAAMSVPDGGGDAAAADSGP